MKRKFSFPRKEPRFAPWLFSLSWEQRKVGDFAKVLSAARVHKHEWTEQGVPFFRSSDVMRVHNGRENEKVYISQELFEDLSMVSGRPEKGDIFITGGGSIGMPYIVPNDNPLYSKDADLLWIKKSENHNSQYLYSYFFTPTFRNYIASISHIGTIAHYTIVQVKETPVLLPKIREQEKIGSFFSNLDSLITLHQRGANSWVRVRFRRFCSTTIFWEQRKVGDFAKVLSAARVHKHEWTEQGVPFFRSSDVMRVHNGRENEKVYISQELFEDLSMVSGRPEKGDIFITGGGSIGMPYIVPNDNPLYSKDADLLWIKKSENHNSQYLYSYFFTPTFRNYIASISHIGTIAHYTIVQVKETPVLLPKIREQEKIGSFFSNLDSLITLHQCKLRMLSKLRKMQILHENALLRRRQTPAWEQRKLGELADKVTEKNSEMRYTETFTNSAESGIISQRDYFDHDISNSDNLNGYYVVAEDDFVYNPRISTTAPVGPVNRNKLNRKGVMSPLYTVFRTHDVDETYLEHFFKSDHWHAFMYLNGDSGARSDRFSIKDSVFMTMPVAYPCLAEQRQIGRLFDEIMRLITLHQREFTHTNPNTNYVKYYQRNRPLLCVLRSMDKSV